MQKYKMQKAPSAHKQLKILKGTLNQLIPLNYSWSPCTCLRDCLAVLIPHDPVYLLNSSRLESQPSDLPFTCNTDKLAATLYLLMRTLATCMFATVGVFCGYGLSVQTWIYMKCFNRRKLCMHYMQCRWKSLCYFVFVTNPTHRPK